MDLVRGKKAIFDPLPKRISVDRVSKVGVRVPRLISEGRRRHAELIGRLKIVEDRAPRAVVARAAAMALIDNHQVEEIGRERLEQANPPLVLGQRLIDGKIHFASEVGNSAFDLPTSITECRKDAVLWLIDKDVAIPGPDQSCGGMSGTQILRLIPQTVTAKCADADDVKTDRGHVQHCDPMTGNVNCQKWAGRAGN